MSRTVAGTLVDVLEKVGVRQIFGLIGDSLNPIADAPRSQRGRFQRVRNQVDLEPVTFDPVHGQAHAVHAGSRSSPPSR